MTVKVIGTNPDQPRVFLYYDDDGDLVGGHTEISENQLRLISCNCGKECCE